VLREFMRALVGAQVRLQHMLMADAFGIAGGRRLDIGAVQHLVKQHAVDAAAHPPQPVRRRVPELGDGKDAGATEPFFHPFADAVDLLQFEAEQDVRQLVLGDDDKAVGLLHVGGDLAEKDIGCEADRAGEAFADLVAQRPLDLERKLARDRHLPLGAHQAASHFVDRADFLDRQAGVDRLEDPLVIVGIEAVIGLHRDHGRAQPPRVLHERAGLDAVGLGRVAGGDRHGGIRRRLHDDDGLAAQRRVFLLFARRKKGVEIEKQPLDRIFGR
jgi:hypothetical protein